MKTKTTVWNVAEHLKTKEEREAYLNAAFEDGDASVIAAALELRHAIPQIPRLTIITERSPAQPHQDPRLGYGIPQPRKPLLVNRCLPNRHAISVSNRIHMRQPSQAAVWHKVSDTPCQFGEWCEKPGERDSHKAVPIAVTPHRLIAAEVPLELSLSKPSSTITLSVASLSVIYGPLEPEKSPHGSDRRENKRFKHPYI